MILHNTIHHIYDRLLKPFIDIEVLSDKGWEKINSLNISYDKKIYMIQTKDFTLRCTGDHILIDENGNEIFAKDALNKIIKTTNGNQCVTSVSLSETTEDVYDLSLEGNNNLYYTNNILSHNCLIIDEMAFIPKNIMDEFWASIVPIVSSSKNSKIIVVSTPNGASGLYYELWQTANSKEGKQETEGWKPFRIHWWDTGGIRDEQWKRQQIASIGLERWKQEYECDFLTSSTSRLIPDDIIERMRMDLSELKIKSKEFYDGKSCKVLSDKKDKVYEFTMWHEFDKDHTYAASGDVSDGIGVDTSVLYVWDITDLREIKMCAKFASNQVSPMEFAFITNRILELYNKPYYICERNGVGAGYLDALRLTYEYPRLVNEAKNGEVGVFSHNTVKMKSCLWARDMMTTQGFGFKIYDKDLVEEFSTFCKKDTKGALLQYAALAKCHDDHVMAFCWLCRLLNPEVIEKYYIVCTTFTSSIGNVFPQIVHPQELYTDKDLKKVSDDPVYQDFLEFKEKMLNKFQNLMNDEINASKNDYMFQAPQDMYFGGDDGPSWNCPTQTSFNPTTVSPYNSVPTFFIN